MTIEGLSAITLGTTDMAGAVAFYETLGFRRLHGGPGAAFTSFAAGAGYLNLIFDERRGSATWWGRAIFHVADVDAVYRIAVEAGLPIEAPPADAPWGERYFHLTDPDGHEISIARRLSA